MDSSRLPVHVRKQWSNAQVSTGLCPTLCYTQCVISIPTTCHKLEAEKHLLTSHLNMMPVVAANTLDPSGDHVTRDRPPPPTRLKATNFSMATSHTYMAVSAAEAVSRTSPCGLHVTLVTGEWCGLCSTVAQLVEGRVTTEFGSTCHTNTPPSQPTASSDADIGLGSDKKELNVCME